MQAFSTGLLSAFGHDPKIAIRDFQGDAQFTPGQEIKDAQMRLSIRADSLEVVDDITDKDRQDIQHRMHHEVLETDRFPEIVYECSQVTGSSNADRYWLVLKGELSLRGITGICQCRSAWLLTAIHCAPRGSLPYGKASTASLLFRPQQEPFASRMN